MRCNADNLVTKTDYCGREPFPSKPARRRPGIRQSYSKKGRKLSLLLAMSLPLLHLARVMAEDDNQAGYRREYYREDGERIRVDTDSMRFDVGLRKNVRLNGDIVLDAISGASPTGAPPQTRWPFPTFGAYYRQAYGSFFQSAVNDPNNLVLFESGIFSTFKDYTNYVAMTNPQIPFQATNAAAASYQSLTNHSSLHNSKVPLSELHDRRTAVSLGLPITMGIHEITPGIAYSEESDYLSWGGSLNYSIALNSKNTILSLGWAHNADSVRDDKLVWQDKTTDDFFVGVSQLLTPKSYLTVNGSFSTEHGYLSDPYRGVMLSTKLQNNPDDAALSAERRPRNQNKQTLFVSWTQFVPPLYGSVELSYRFFHDSYGIYAHTLDCSWHIKVGETLVVSPVFRYYHQSAASFYYVLVPDYFDKSLGDYKPSPAYYSSDYRLSQLQSFSAGVNVSWRLHKHLSLDASYVRYVMQGLDGDTSPSAYPAANIASLGLRVWF